jgi:hypothetical protein
VQNYSAKEAYIRDAVQNICFRRDGKYFSPPSNLAGEKVWKNTEAQKQHFLRQSLQTFPQ